MDKKGNGEIVELLFRQLIAAPASTPDSDKDIMVQLRNRTGSIKNGSGDRKSFDRRSTERRSSRTLSTASQSSSSDSVHSVEEKPQNGLSNLKQAMTTTLMRSLTMKKEKKSFKVAIIGAKSVGKSAMTVRIKTRKFIHSYAPNMESKCSFQMNIDDENVNIDLLDTAALQTAESAGMEDKIRWADAFILAYSITDEASLSALVASKCLINLYARRKKKLSTSFHPGHTDLIVALVGNKNDLEHEREVSEEQARSFAEVNEFSHFFELSTRESYDSVKSVVESLYRSYKQKSHKTIRAVSPRPSMVPSVTTEPPEETTEDDRISAVRQRGRSRAITISNPSPNNSQHDVNAAPESKYSPVTFRKIISEETSVYSSSPEEERHFIAEEIMYNNEANDTSKNLKVPSRRVTVHSSPTSNRRNKSNLLTAPAALRRAESVEPKSSDKNNNNSNSGTKPHRKLGKLGSIWSS